jgi:hypothetical protein
MREEAWQLIRPSSGGGRGARRAARLVGRSVAFQTEETPVLRACLLTSCEERVFSRT